MTLLLEYGFLLRTVYPGSSAPEWLGFICLFILAQTARLGQGIRHGLSAAGR